MSAVEENLLRRAIFTAPKGRKTAPKGTARPAGTLKAEGNPEPCVSELNV